MFGKHSLSLPIALSTLLVSGWASLQTPALAQEVAVQEDTLNTVGGLPWGADVWPFKTVVKIEKFGGELAGKAVLDRDAKDNLIDPISRLTGRNPFGSPEPVTSIFVTAWSSKTNGCFMDMLVQYAPKPEYQNASREEMAPFLIPREVQIAVGNSQVVTLTPQKIPPRIGGPYRYDFYFSSTKNRQPSSWYMARSLYAINAEQAAQLSNAKPGAAPIRVTFPEGSPYQFQIGEETVKRWKDVFSFNPTCRPGGSTTAAQPTSAVNPPALAGRVTTPVASQINPTGEVARYPTTAEFNTFNRKIRTATSAVRLTPTAKKARQAYQKKWSSVNKSVVRFLGAWSNGERWFYVYPSQVKGRACVVTQVGEVQDVRIATVLNKEMRIGAGSFFWVDQETVLAARDRGGDELFPIYAGQSSPTLSPEAIEIMDKAQCEKTLPSDGQVTTSQLNY